MRWAIASLELYLLIWFVVVGFEAFMQRATGLKAPSPFDLLEFHHAYLGAGLVALGFWMHTVIGTFVQLLGLIFTIDDHIQHAVQTYSEDREYRSPLHELFAKTLWRIPGMPTLVHFLDTRWPWLVLLGAAALFVLGCAPARSLVPMALRPDTRRLNGVLFDSLTAARTLETFRSALPNEASVCYSGELRDTLLPMGQTLIVRLRNAVVTVQDSADPSHVWYPREPRNGCAGRSVIGIAHDHPYVVAPDDCTHSDLDAYVLSSDPRLLFSIVFCGDGRLEVMYQDTRRVPDRWAPDSVP